jgi:3-deoxy-D-manno-octulosonate 8-phosphate phosphatase (KDO 8-P phosphatase)
LQQKLGRIKLVVLDVDGVLSDGRIIYDVNGIEYKCFDAHDGFGISRALEKGLKLAIISGRESEVVHIRARELGITDVFQNSGNKVLVFENLRARHKLTSSQCCFIGDDEFDLSLLNTVGFSAAPADAIKKVRNEVDYVAAANGGRGAVREILDMILHARKLL